MGPLIALIDGPLAPDHPALAGSATVPGPSGVALPTSAETPRRGLIAASPKGAADRPANPGDLLASPGAGQSPGARHAAAIARAILAGCPGARFVSLPVFGARLVTDASGLAQALEAAAEAELVHCSLGLARPDEAVRRAVEALIGAGRLVVAAAPARGGPAWPAGFPGVASVQGDARCGPGEWSLLDLPRATFGACPRLEGEAVAGASVAAAHFSGLIARRLAGSTPARALSAMRAGARHVGRERRR